ncbi:MAG: hypothetical protein VKQ33_07115 [Candidatus Sericytochromatia bacterium]|nr:hypothetical protein [Candidatus Sericytochromatia bacterium]
MPQIDRPTLLANLSGSLAALPGQDPEAVLAAAIAAAGLPERPAYSPDETALIARALLARAAAEGEAALASWQASPPQGGG